MQHFLLSVDDVMLTLVQHASKQNKLIFTVECSVWLMLSKLCWTISHGNNYNHNQGVKWQLNNISCINRQSFAEHFMQQFFRFCLSVCQTITFKSLDIGSSYLHIRCISRVYRSTYVWRSLGQDRSKGRQPSSILANETCVSGLIGIPAVWKCHRQ